MCDESAFHKLVSRVDELAKKMAVMESTQTVTVVVGPQPSSRQDPSIKSDPL